MKEDFPHATNIGGALKLAGELTEAASKDIAAGLILADQGEANAVIGAILNTADRLEAALTLLRGTVLAHRARS